MSGKRGGELNLTKRISSKVLGNIFYIKWLLREFPEPRFFLVGKLSIRRKNSVLVRRSAIFLDTE